MKNKTYIILSVFFLASLFLIFFCIYPLLKSIEKDSGDFILAKNKIISMGEQISEIENFKRNYNFYKPNLEKIDDLFVDSSNPVDFIEFLEAEAAKYKLTSKISLSPLSKLSDGQMANFMVMQFSSTGIYEDFLKFIEEIEFGPYLIEIENLNIKNSIAEPKKVDAIFSIKVFIKK